MRFPFRCSLIVVCNHQPATNNESLPSLVAYYSVLINAPTPDAMTAVPISRQSSSSKNANDTNSNAVAEAKPVLALKELVARLHKEQHKIQNLLSSLGFALRSFNNLNQFLELIPLMAARVADADGGALILFKQNGQISLEQLHCQESQACENIRRALEQATRQLTAPDRKGRTVSINAKERVSIPASLDEQVRQSLGLDVRLFGTPILVKGIERGRLYIFSRDPEYTWTPTRQKLVQLVADQTAVAIAKNERPLNCEKKNVWIGS